MQTATAVGALAVIAVACASSVAQPSQTSWLDAAPLQSWNEPGMSLPSAPQAHNTDPRCRQLLRAPDSVQDEQLRAHGWDLIGAPSARGQIRVVAGAADYDGMCRPLQYQEFVFVRGIFAGTLAPRPMDSRTDGAVGRVSIEDDRKLTAEYTRYERTDPLCCPSRTTTVAFDIGNEPPLVRPVAATTSANPQPAQRR